MIMFRKRDEPSTTAESITQFERITSVLGTGVNYIGKIKGRGGVRIEGTFEGEIALNGMLVIGTTGRVTCEHVIANTVIVAGAVKGDISAEKVEIRSTGRVYGDVNTTAFSTEEGAFLRGQIQMDEEIELDLPIDGDDHEEQSAVSDEGE